MNDDELRDLLTVLERPVLVTAEYGERVVRAMLDELQVEPPAPRSRVAERHRRIGWRPLLAAAAVFIAVAVAASVLLVGTQAPSALAALQEARSKFRGLPAYHARTAVRANENSSNPDFETAWATQDSYKDAHTWRTTFVSSNASIGQPGDYQVLGGGLYGQYQADANIFTVTPEEERRQGGDLSSPADFFDPSLQWWSTGEPGEPGRPSDRFFEENCSTKHTTYLGRAATALHCPAKPRAIDLVLDDDTGMLLRISIFDIVREITSIEFDPPFGPGLFDVRPPAEAKKRWGGSGPPPAEYQVAPGAEVAARYQVTDPDTAGMEVLAVTRTDVWVQSIRCGASRCDHHLHRVDARSGRVKAVIDPPDGAFINDVEELNGHIWVSMSERGPDQVAPAPTYVQRLDPETNTFTGPKVATGQDGGRLKAVGRELWTTGGNARQVRVGPAETRYRSVARIDPATGAVTQIPLDGGAIAGPVYANGHVWVGTEKLNEKNPYQTDYAVVAIDPATNTVVRRITAPSWPGSLTFVDNKLFVVFGVAERGRTRWLIGVATPDASTFATREIAPAGSELGPSVFAGGTIWVTSFLTDTVLKIDPASLAVTANIATGRGPSGIGAGLGSVWVANGKDGTLVRIDVQ